MQVLILAARATDIVFQLEVTRSMQVEIDIGKERADIVLQWKDTRGIKVGIDIGNESDGYRLTLGRYSEDAGRY